MLNSAGFLKGHRPRYARSIMALSLSPTTYGKRSPDTNTRVGNRLLPPTLRPQDPIELRKQLDFLNINLEHPGPGKAREISRAMLTGWFC